MWKRSHFHLAHNGPSTWAVSGKPLIKSGWPGWTDIPPTKVNLIKTPLASAEQSTLILWGEWPQHTAWKGSLAMLSTDPGQQDNVIRSHPVTLPFRHPSMARDASHSSEFSLSPSHHHGPDRRPFLQLDCPALAQDWPVTFIYEKWISSAVPHWHEACSMNAYIIRSEQTPHAEIKSFSLSVSVGAFINWNECEKAVLNQFQLRSLTRLCSPYQYTVL